MAATTRQRQPLHTYLTELGQHAMLTREEEHVLALEYRRTGSPDLARRLACAHLRLVVKIARDYTWARHDLLDLIDEGNIGLLVAVRKYDPDRGVRLSTYAAWWIRAMILRFIVENWRLVRIGTTGEQRKVMFRLRAEKAQLDMLGIVPDMQVLAERLGVRATELPALERHIESSEVALDAPTHAEGGDTRAMMLAAPGDTRPDEVVEQADFQARLREAVDAFELTLASRDRAMFRARWRQDEQPTLQEMGNRMGISRERARQIEKRLLDRFREFVAGRLESPHAELAELRAA